MIIFLLFSFLFFLGCGKAPSESSASETVPSESSSSEDVSSKTKVTTDKVDQRSRKELLEAYKRQRAEIAQKEKELAEKEKDLEETRSLLTNAQNDAKHTRWKLYLILFIVGLIILGIVGTVVIAAIRNPKIRPIPVASRNCCCPRCGWEHKEGETECQNCHTHL